MLSVGLAVRNGRRSIQRCIESILSQDFADLEFVVCDNASDDDTVEILKRYERDDPRLKLHVNKTNIGIHENMRRVFELSRGKYFRWISADDWVEPKCLNTCTSFLEKNPDAIGVTTRFTVYTPGRPTRYEEFHGEFPDSFDPARRFERMLWFFHAGDGKYDPMYGVYRRECLMRTRLLRPSEKADWLLSAELALLGPIMHLPTMLANRTRTYPRNVDRIAFMRRLDPVRAERLRVSAHRMHRELYALAVSADLSKEQFRRCGRALRRFWFKEITAELRSKLADAWHRFHNFGDYKVLPQD